MKKNNYRDYEFLRLQYKNRPTAYIADSERLRLKFPEPLEISECKIIKFRSPEQAFNWVMWLRKHQRILRLSSEKIYQEVKFQSEHQYDSIDLLFSNSRKSNDEELFNDHDRFINEYAEFKKDLEEKSELFYKVSQALNRGIEDMEFKCEKCGRMVNFKYYRIIKERGKLINSETKVISRGLTGGSVARQTTNTYESIYFRVCADCEKKYNSDNLKKELKGCIIPLVILVVLLIATIIGMNS